MNSLLTVFLSEERFLVNEIMGLPDLFGGITKCRRKFWNIWKFRMSACIFKMPMPFSIPYM